MHRFLAVIVISMCLAGLGCSGSGASDANADNSSVATGEFSNITDANEALAIGDQLLENNETEKAIDAFLRATELDPNLAEAWFKLGIAYALIEKEQALSVQADVNAVDNTASQKTSKPNSEKAFRKAIEAYKKILSQNPDDDVAQFNLGRAYNKLNEDQEAAKALKQAVKIKPDDTEYQTELGAILIKLAQYREAIPPLKKALELDPENSRAADLLEDAEAGRNRIDYVPPKTEDKTSNSNSNANTATNANVSTGSNTSASPTPTPKRPGKPEPSESKTRPGQKPANKPN